MVRASEELTHILYLAAEACSPGQEFLVLCLSEAKPHAKEVFRSDSSVSAADLIKEIHGLSTVLHSSSAPELGVRAGQGFQVGSV